MVSGASRGWNARVSWSRSPEGVPQEAAAQEDGDDGEGEREDGARVPGRGAVPSEDAGSQDGAGGEAQQRDDEVEGGGHVEGCGVGRG